MQERFYMLSAESRSRLRGLAVVLACLSAGAYVLIGAHILGVGSLQASDVPAAIIFAAAGCYVLGGLLILLRWRWLWIAAPGLGSGPMRCSSPSETNPSMSSPVRWDWWWSSR